MATLAEWAPTIPTPLIRRKNAAARLFGAVMSILRKKAVELNIEREWSARERGGGGRGGRSKAIIKYFQRAILYAYACVFVCECTCLMITVTICMLSSRMSRDPDWPTQPEIGKNSSA